jgi:hypothetical protein
MADDWTLGYLREGDHERGTRNELQGCIRDLLKVLYINLLGVTQDNHETVGRDSS